MIAEIIAMRLLTELVKHVLAHQGKTLTGITYQELARRIALLNKHGEPHCRFNRSLSIMGRWIGDADVGESEKPPSLSALVVRKCEGLPAKGMKEFCPGYDKLSNIEKRSKSLAKWQAIADYGTKWNRVLRALGLDEIMVSAAGQSDRIQPGPTPDKDDPSCRFGSGGESPAHKALKKYVSIHPELVGAAASAVAHIEYELPSLDTLDVLFKMPDRWVGVEVKSTVSDQVPGDYERGVYQAVKYKALLEAMQKDARHVVPDSVEVILVLEGRLPARLKALAKSLSVRIVENIKAKPSP